MPKKYGGGSLQFWMFDVGGQRGERKKWIQVRWEGKNGGREKMDERRLSEG